MVLVLYLSYIKNIKIGYTKMGIRIVSGRRLRELEAFLDEAEYPSHCVHCPGLKGEPLHHPSYEVTGECNLNCVFCYAYSAKKAGKLPNPGYYGCEDARAITVSQYGEPTIIGLEKLEKLFSLLKKKFGARIDLQTNGVLLDREVSADLVMVSLSASNRKSYASLTGHDFFERVVKNLNFVKKGIIRCVFLPGINDGEVVEIGKIADEKGMEFMLQPCSIHPGLKERLEKAGYDFERDTLYDYLDSAERSGAKIPGCLLKIVRDMLELESFEEIAFSRKGFSSRPPEIRREWKFCFDL